MNIRIILSILAVIVGLFFGSSDLEIREATNPPITWNDIPFILFFSIIGIVFVTGIQIFRKESKYSKNAIAFFFLGSLWTISAGISTFIASETLSPESTVYLNFGFGMLLGVILSSFIFKWRYGQTP